MTTLPQTAPIRIPRPLPSTSLASPGGGMMGMVQPPINNALTGADAWRIIRANVWLIIAFLVLGGVVGYGVNYWLALKHSRYTSTALLEVQTLDDRPRLDQSGGVNTAGLDVDLHTQAELLMHERLLSSVITSSDALRGTSWFKQFVTVQSGQPVVDAQEAKQELLKGLLVTPLPQSRLIRLQMSYSIPKDCQTIVKELGDEHIKEQKVRLTIANDLKASSLEQLKMNYESEIRDNTTRMVRIATDLGKLGVSTGGGPSSKDFELQQLIAEQLKAANILGTAEAKSNTFENQMKTSSAPELEEALQKSFTYSEARRQADDAALLYDEVVTSNGPENPRSKALKRRVDTLQQRVADSENDIKARTAELIRANLQNDVSAAQEAGKRINVRVDQIRQEIADLAQKRNEYERLAGQVAVTRSQLDHLKDETDKASFLWGNGRWSQIDWATQPDLPDRPSFPKLANTMGIALVIGLALSLGIAFLRELSDNSVRTPRDIARIGNMTPLGVIPHEADDPQSAGARLPLVIFEAPHSIIAEQFRQVRTRLQHSASLDTTRSILVTGCSPEDGKTTVAVNLAAGLALNGRRILIVDANFRRPNLHNVFGQANEVGFGDALNNLEVFEEAVHETEVPNLSVITAGQKPSNATELLESQLLVDFIERALEEFDHIVFDSGPLLMVSESIALAPRVDGVVTVVRARGNSRGMLTRMRDELRRLKAEHLGVILNAVRVHGGGYYGPMIKNYYAYQNG
ncbi:MAG: hypothetical protein JWP03_5223 [Phycisphaerales bacterium]|jgi:succinoglycan biosynthesis transport protein ExoP|nr:hypothetical protein [Phycisphaerales bacterium]